MAIRRRLGIIGRLMAALCILVTISARAQMNPWVRPSPNNHGVIVFVHGVLGNARSTWTSGSAYWPEMLTRDHTFDGQGIYVYQYHSPILEDAFSIDEVAQNMWSTLTAEGVLEHHEITFVSHSMGGVVTRAFILKHREEVAPKVRMLYFLATPGTGNSLAEAVSLLSSNPQFRGISPMKADTYLARIQSDWFAAKMGLKSYCGYETIPIRGHLVVDLVSATRLCTMTPDPIDADHFSISKPKDQHSAPYIAVKAAFIDSTPPAPKQPMHNAKNTSRATAGSSDKALADEMAKLNHSSFEKVDRFTTSVPFLISDNAAEIPLDDNRNDPFGRTYAALRAIASFPRDESRGAQRIDSVKMPGEEIQVFLARILQYYVVRSIFEIQDPTTTWSFNDVDGLTTDAPAPVYVPDQEAYPRDKWLGQAQSLGLNYSRYNERTLPLVSVPRGATLSLSVEDTGGKSPTRYAVRVDRRPDFSLSFILTPTMSGARTLPRSFMIEPRFYRGNIETYTYNFIVDFDFTWNGDRDKGERYQEWALGLVSGMKKRLATSGP